MQDIIFAIIGIMFSIVGATQVVPTMGVYIQSQRASNLVK